MPIMNARGLNDVAPGLTVAALIVCLLYLAGSIVEPLVIAALLILYLRQSCGAYETGAFRKLFLRFFRWL
jgi:hypothetical protein